MDKMEFDWSTWIQMVIEHLRTGFWDEADVMNEIHTVAKLDDKRRKLIHKMNLNREEMVEIQRDLDAVKTQLRSIL